MTFEQAASHKLTYIYRIYARVVWHLSGCVMHLWWSETDELLGEREYVTQNWYKAVFMTRN